LTKKYTKHKEPWGSFIDAKANAPQVLLKEVTKKKKGSVYVSSLTDPYQPIEKKYKLTRKCLQILLRNNFFVCVQTKSSLVLRDLDIFKKFRERCEVGFTITTLDEKIRKVFEPNSSSVEEKLKALKLLNENGINTYVFFGPILPFLSDKNLVKYFTTMKKLGVNSIMIDKLNLKPGVWKNLMNVLQENYPNLVEKWRKIFFGKSDYYKNLKFEIRRICNKSKINCIFCY
jgi:DNA repair photolyase